MKLHIVNVNVDECQRYIGFASSLSEISQISYSTSSEDAILSILKNESQILLITDDFLYNSSCDFLKSLSNINFKIYIIVLSRNTSFTLNPSNSIVSDVILFPFSKEKIKDSLKRSFYEILETEKREERKRTVKNVKVRISAIDGYFLENLNTLAYCIASGTYTNIHLSNGNTIFSSYHLGRIEKVLKYHHFVRVNRSVLVNLGMVKMINKAKGICILDVGNESKEFKLTQMCMKNLELKKIV